MSVILIRCPETGRAISTDIECDSDTFGKLPFVVTQTLCPRCGREHKWSKQDAWLSDDDQTSAVIREHAG